MFAVPKFQIYDEQREPEGVFEWGESRDEIFDRYYEAQDLYFMGELNRAQKLAKTLIKEDPHFINGFLLLGDLEIEKGNTQQAIGFHKKAVEIGEKIIPPNFEGKIRWGFTENRPFLTALNSYAQDLLDQGKYEDALPYFEQLLAYNPEDNQGIRFLIGDLYFVADNTKQAETAYKKNLDYPPYRYSYGLLQFSRGNFARAAKFFRKGIISNIYISDVLRGKLPIIDYQIWHASNFELPETAYAYLNVMSHKWVDFPKAFDLLNFLHITDPSRSEIEQIYLLKQDLYFSDGGFADTGFADFGFDDIGFDEEPDYDMREEILSEIEQIEKQIDDSSSKELIKQWQEAPFEQRPDL